MTTPLTLEQFRATKRVVETTAEWRGEFACADDVQNVALYEGDGFIQIEPNGTFYLVIHNCQWSSANLAELEEILYNEWYLGEVVPMPDQD